MDKNEHKWKKWQVTLIPIEEINVLHKSKSVDFLWHNNTQILQNAAKILKSVGHGPISQKSLASPRYAWILPIILNISSCFFQGYQPSYSTVYYASSLVLWGKSPNIETSTTSTRKTTWILKAVTMVQQGRQRCMLYFIWNICMLLKQFLRKRCKYIYFSNKLLNKMIYNISGLDWRLEVYIGHLLIIEEFN